MRKPFQDHDSTITLPLSTGSVLVLKCCSLCSRTLPGVEGTLGQPHHDWNTNKNSNLYNVTAQKKRTLKASWRHEGMYHFMPHFDASVQDCSNSIVNTLEEWHFLTKPSICSSLNYWMAHLHHWSLGDLLVILDVQFSNTSQWLIPEYFLWNYPDLNARGPCWWYNIRSGNSLVPSGNKNIFKALQTITNRGINSTAFTYMSHTLTYSEPGWRSHAQVVQYHHSSRVLEVHQP